jgi:anti-sigma B factor antagonist
VDLEVRSLQNKITVISLDGEMDLYNSHKLKELVTGHFEGSTGPLILDFEGLSYIDSSGISVLLYTFTQAKKRRLGIWFVNVHGSVRKVIELTSLLGFFPIADSLEDAVRTLN